MKSYYYSSTTVEVPADAARVSVHAGSASSASATVSLPARIDDDVVLVKADSSANTVTISAVDGLKIDGAATYVLSGSGEFVTLTRSSDGWAVVDSNRQTIVNTTQLADIANQTSRIANPVPGDSGKVWTANANGTAEFKSSSGGGAASFIDITNPPEGYASCVGDGTTDNSTAFAALLTLAGTRGCDLYVPKGTFIIGPFSFAGKQGVRIIGQGRTVSWLKLKAGSNADFVTLGTTDNQADSCGLMHIGLDGNGVNQTGLWAGLDVRNVNRGCCFDDVCIQYAGHGLAVGNGGASYAWVYQFRNFEIMWSYGRGINGVGTDNTYHNFLLGGSQDYEVYAVGGNVLFSSFKCMGSKTASGWFIKGGRMCFSNIDSQENFLHGMQLQFAYDCTFDNITLDNNGYNWPDTNSPKVPKATIDAYGMSIESCENITVNGLNFSNRDANLRYGIGAYKVWNGVQANNYPSRGIRIHLNNEKNPGAKYVSGTSKITFGTTTITTTDYDFTGFNVGDQVVISGCTVNAGNNKYATITGVAAKVLTFGAGTFTAGAETAAITILGPKRSVDSSSDGVDLIGNTGALYITSNYTLKPEDIGKDIYAYTTGAITITVPSVANCPDIRNGKPRQTRIIRNGTGTVTLAGESGVNFYAKGLGINVTYSGTAVLAKDPFETNRWHVTGDIA